MSFYQEFNGKLSPEEVALLESASFTKRQIEKIERFLTENKDLLTGFCDVVGDDEIPTKQFLFNIKHIGKLLDEDPHKSLSKFGVQIRRMTTARLVRLLAHNFMTSKQVFENRNQLMNPANKNISAPDKGIELPKEPVIWGANHHFKDDALATVRAAQRPVTMIFGSIPLYFNTTDGILSYLIGSILVNRKAKRSRDASIPKAKLAIDFGSDLLWCPEGVHNKTSNLLTLDLWKGIYRVANDTGTKVVPIVHYIFDPTQRIVPHESNPIHTVIDDPIDLTRYSEKAGLEYLRDVISTWYYLMLEKYGKMNREELIHSYQKRAIYYGAEETNFSNAPITAHEIGILYNWDLRSTVNGYDRSIEANADCRSNTIVRPEDAFDLIAKSQNPINIGNILYASEVVRERRREDYQRLF